MEKNKMNIKTTELSMRMHGADEVLEKIDELNMKLTEAKSLIDEINSAEVKINIEGANVKLQSQDSE
jgi:oligoribonuclease (3'-5' exoribonuclease)